MRGGFPLNELDSPKIQTLRFVVLWILSTWTGCGQPAARSSGIPAAARMRGMRGAGRGGGRERRELGPRER